MFIVIKVDGSVYTSKDNNEITAEEAADKTYNLLAGLQNTAMLVHLAGAGGILVLGPEVLARAHITYHDG